MIKSPLKPDSAKIIAPPLELSSLIVIPFPR